jgi:2-methylisocitrate lyase-like PEP mutase family enzyme
MRRAVQRQRAEAFHRLHAGDGRLILINAWDAASARLFEQAGSPAINIFVYLCADFLR